MTLKSWSILLSSAADAISSAISNNETHQFQKKSVLALKPFIPYYLHEADEQNFIWLNRAYKPLGIKTNEYVDYMQFPWLHVHAGEPVASLGRFCLFEGYPPWELREDAERLVKLIGALVSPNLDMRDANGKAFRMLVECDHNWKQRFGYGRHRKMMKQTHGSVSTWSAKVSDASAW